MFPETFEIGDEFGYDGTYGAPWIGKVVDKQDGKVKYEYYYTRNPENTAIGSNSERELQDWLGNGRDGRFHRRGYVVVDHELLDN